MWRRVWNPYYEIKMSKNYPKPSDQTIAVHGGERETERQNRSVTTPLEQTATYYFKNTQQVIDFYEGKLPGIKYGRYGCPTQHALEQKLADLEGAERALVFASGMAAEITLFLSFLKPGDRVVYYNDCYRNTRRFFTEIAPRYGIQCTAIPFDQINHIEKFLNSDTHFFFAEIPTNPFLRVLDLARINKLKNKYSFLLVIDSTLATPINFKPLRHGADLVVHSATKYFGGHHDLFAGVVAGKKELIAPVQSMRDILGGMIDPHNSYLLLRSLQTLFIRMKEFNERGLELARFLQKCPEVEKVWYTGLPSHPDFKTARKLFLGHSGLITFSLKANKYQTGKFVDYLKIPYIATNFGGPQSLIEQHALQTFYKSSAQERTKLGMTDNLLRYAVGFEDINDVMSDFKQALSKIKTRNK